MGGSISAGLTVIISGRAEDEERLTRILDGDPGIGVIRHADAGYQSSIDILDQAGLVAPMISRNGKGTP
jgi:urocanate hydratase